MAKLTWDGTGERFYETGVDHGVLYLLDAEGKYSNGVAWNGLTSVSMNPSGGEPSPFWADNIKYLNIVSAEDVGLTIEAYTYPEEFEECDGSASLATGAIIHQQARKTFGFCYRTILGNDVNSNEHGYKLHLVYGCLASPTEKSYNTVNDSPDIDTFSWEVSTTPVAVAGFKPTAYIEIDSTKATAAKLTSLEEALYGSETKSARLPLPDEVKTLLT